MRRPRTDWVIFSMVIILLFIVSFLFGREGGRHELFPVRSTYHPTPGGVKAAYLFLRELGFQVERWRKPFQDLPREGRLLFTVAPLYPLNQDEVDRLLTWVEGGGVVVYVEDRPTSLLKRLDVAVASWEGQEEALPAIPSVYTLGIEVLSPRGQHRFVAQPGMAVHVGQGRSGLVLSFRRGEGKVILIADPELLSNRGIGQADNGRLLVNIAGAHGSGGRIFFDEYHQGYFEEEGLMSYLGRTTFPLVALQGFLIALVFIFSKGTRLGRPIPLAEEERRSSLEYVDSMARIYQAAKAGGLALEALHQRLRTDLAKALQVPPSTDGAALAQRAAPLFKMDQGELFGVLSRSFTTARKGALSEGELLTLARGIQRVRRKLKPASKERGTHD
ncbi:MAG: DUF4350 domain-containing protein [candidate division NC10 bacterium]|nr:DUF4350 domain-containing protein [candidate division NC10 bacterium]